MKRRYFLAGLTLPVIVAGCQANRNSPVSSSDEAEDGPAVQVVRNSKTLVMATAANYPPYEQRSGAESSGAIAQTDRKTARSGSELAGSESTGTETTGSETAGSETAGSELAAGEVVGFDIDLAELIAGRLGRNLSIVDLEFGAIIPALVNDEVDIAMAAIEPTRSRKRDVDFSDIYYRSRQALISLDGYLRSRDLSYQTIGIRADSVQARYANRLNDELPDLDIVEYDTLQEVFDALDVGAIEAAILEANIADNYLRRYPDFAAVVMPSERATGSAIALPKNSPLRREINAALSDIKSSGEMEKLIDKWFS